MDEAIACCRKAVEIDPKFAFAYQNLGWTLHGKGQLDEAIACYKAIEFDLKFALANNNLGWALQSKGQLDEAIAYYKKAIELDSKYALARNNLAEAERLAAARDKLPAFQKGTYTPASNAERLALAEWCQIKKLRNTAKSLYNAAFVAAPKLADDFNAAHRYSAACEAALAATGQSEDAVKLDDKERARLRKQALEWQRADLVQRGQLIESGTPGDRANILLGLRNYWQQESAFATRQPWLNSRRTTKRRSLNSGPTLRRC